MTIKAVGMISGGLDSTVAACLMREQGIEVVGVNFSTGFCLTDHQRLIANFSPDGSSRRKKKLRNEALRAGADLSFPVEIIDISSEYLPVVTNPRYGYGSAMNPCIDCRIFMLGKAKAFMEQIGAKFVFTGEVLGQRPMTQHARTLGLIARKSGLGRLLLRPLSAQLLPPTLPEDEGWVDRDRLQAIKGRGRGRQIELAASFGVTDYPQPAGGCCFLTDTNFAKRLRDLLEHRPHSELTHQDFVLLKLGRHMRLGPGTKLILGRDEGENTYIERFLKQLTQIRPKHIPGPTGVLQGDPSPAEIALAASIAAYYTSPKGTDPIELDCTDAASTRTVTAKPMTPAEIESYRL